MRVTVAGERDKWLGAEWEANGKQYRRSASKKRRQEMKKMLKLECRD